MNACLIWDHYSGYYKDPGTVTVLLFISNILAAYQLNVILFFYAMLV